MPSYPLEPIGCEDLFLARQTPEMIKTEYGGLAHRAGAVGALDDGAGARGERLVGPHGGGGGEDAHEEGHADLGHHPPSTGRQRQFGSGLARVCGSQYT